MPELEKTSYHTGYNAYKNNYVYTGSYSISGSTSSGANVKSFTVQLRAAPDLLEVTYNGPTDTVFGSDPRPADAWFKQGPVWVRGDNAGAGYTNYPTPWTVYSSISGDVLTITMIYIQQFSSSLTLTSTPMYYRIVDYSIF